MSLLNEFLPSRLRWSRNEAIKRGQTLERERDEAIKRGQTMERERDDAIERRRVLEHELQNARVARRVDDLLRNYDPPLLPRQFLVLSNHYDGLPAENRETFSRHVMTRAISEPGHFRFTDRIDHPLARQAQAAAAFAGGNLPDAAEIFAALEPTEFNVLCRARTLEAIGNFAEAEELLRQRIDRNELYIVMELATLYAQQGNIARANAMVERVAEHFGEEQQAIQPLQLEIDAAIASNAMEKKEGDDIYTENFVVDNWWFYLWTYRTFNEFQHGNMALDTGIRREVGRLLKETIPQTKTFIDFGAFCGFTIHELAEEFPNIRFLGIDRPEVAKRLNDEWFSKSNLKFYADNIMSFLDNLTPGPDTVLFHSRTAVFCYPALLTALYEKCRKLGICNVIMQEGSQIFSRSHLRFYEPGKYPAISVAGRGSTFMHDYQTILQKAGFHVRSNVHIRPKLLLDDRSGFGAHHTVLHAVAD